MPLFRSKPKIIDAVQFTDYKNPPRGVYRYDGEWQDITLGFYVITKQGVNVAVSLGEWIVDEGDGRRFYPIDDAMFRGPRGYDPIEE